MSAPRIAIGPRPDSSITAAVTAGGGVVVDAGDRPDGLVWLDPADLDGLGRYVASAPDAGWVQLPLAGIEHIADAGILDPKRTWTCAKGSYAEPVAEHALALALAGLRRLAIRIPAHSWGAPAGTSLYGQRVTILGGGGIARVLLELLAPFRVETTVVRRSGEPMPGAHRTVPTSELHGVLPGSLLVVLALALTRETEGIIGTTELDLMDAGSWLINVARGKHVDTAALVAALASGSIGGAAIDVTDPEPLPDGHPLWDAPNCIITPHTADTMEMVRPLLAERVRANVQRLGAGQPLLGLVDLDAGY